MGECALEGCEVTKTGVCAYHNAGIERMKGLEKLAEAIPGLVKFMHLTLGGFIVVGAIGLVTVSGFAWYINKTAEEVEAKVDKQQIAHDNHILNYEKKYERTSREVGSLTSKMDAYTTTNQQLLEKMDRSAEQAWGLVNKLVEGRQNETSNTNTM